MGAARGARVRHDAELRGLRIDTFEHHDRKAWAAAKPSERDDAGSSPLQIVVAGLVVAASLVLIVTVVIAGHAGSVAVWSDVG